MIKKMDHVALAVQDADEIFGLLSRLFGFTVAEKREEPQAGFASTLISAGEVRLELLQPLGPQGMIQKFIEKRGGGLHHFSIQVDDLDAEMHRLKGLGVQFVSEQPAQVDDSKVIFIHPRSTGGLLVELVQRI